MPHLKSAALGLAALVLTSVPALAQTGGAMAKGAMATDSMAVSKSDAMTLKACKAMSHDAMMKNAKCQALAKAHPMASDGGAMTKAPMAKDDAMMTKH